MADVASNATIAGKHLNQGIPSRWLAGLFQVVHELGNLPSLRRGPSFTLDQYRTSRPRVTQAPSGYHLRRTALLVLVTWCPIRPMGMGLQRRFLHKAMARRGLDEAHPMWAQVG